MFILMFIFSLIKKGIIFALKNIFSFFSFLGKTIWKNAFLRTAIIIAFLTALFTFKHTKIGFFFNCKEEIKYNSNFKEPCNFYCYFTGQIKSEKNQVEEVLKNIEIEKEKDKKKFFSFF